MLTNRSQGRTSPMLVLAVFLSLAIIVTVGYRFGLAPGPEPDAANEATEVQAEKDQIMVYVVGAVQKPGVYTVPGGCRAVDAIKAAGGLTDKANSAGVNLAAKLHDEQMVRVPAIGEKVPEETATPKDEVEESGGDDEVGDDATPEAGEKGAVSAPSVSRASSKKATSAPMAATSSPTSSPSPLADVERVSLNRASLKELESIPGMTHDMAHSIVDYRTGPPPHAFTSIDDLEVVTGLKGKDLHSLMHYLKL